MKPAVQAFLNQIVDYAGLFPPARLPMPDALQIYLNARHTSPNRFMLGRFVCPAPRLTELLALAKTHPHGSLLKLTALGKPSTDYHAFPGELEATLLEIGKFRLAWGNDSVVDTLEIPLPQAADLDPLFPSLDSLAQKMAQAGLRAFLEIARSDRWSEHVKKTARELGSRTANRDHGPLGLKVRCGGLSADAFPGDEEVAFFLAQCAEAGIPWKATAGLHHPRRHWDASSQVWHHGFFNVFLAGLLARIHFLDATDLGQILADRDGAHFRFENDSIAWRTWSCSTAEIVENRHAFATTFGSCSFDEPCSDLQVMGLLNP